MALPIVPIAWAGAAAATAYVFSNAGDAAEQTGNAALKVGAGAALGLGAYWLLYRRAR